MIDLMKKSMLTGLGIASLTREKIEELSRELMQQGAATEQEGRKFVEEMMGYAEKTRGDMQKSVDSYVEKALEKFDLVRKKDLDELKQAIADLQEQVQRSQVK